MYVYCSSNKYLAIRIEIFYCDDDDDDNAGDAIQMTIIIYRTCKKATAYDAK